MAARKLVEQEMKKKKGGKGLSVLSGRDLFEYNRDLFKDDEEGSTRLEPLQTSPVTNVNGDLPEVDPLKKDSSKNLNGKLPGVEEEKKSSVEEIIDKVQSDLFLDGEDDDLDDLDDLEDD